MDLDPFVPVGIEADTMRVLDVFLLHCLLSPSPPDSPQECVALSQNQHRAAARGREPGITLERRGAEVSLVDWAGELLAECVPIAESLAHALRDERYVQALDAVRRRLAQPDTLPSARALDVIRRDFGGEYTRFVHAQSRVTQQQLAGLPYPPELQMRFDNLALASIEAQKKIEASDSMPFEMYRQAYLAPERLGR